MQKLTTTNLFFNWEPSIEVDTMLVAQQILILIKTALAPCIEVGLFCLYFIPSM